MMRKLISLFGMLKIKLFYRRSICTMGSLHISGYPIIKIASSSRIIIGDNVSLKSNKKSYLAHMHSPVKLISDRSGASIEIGPNTRINGACIHAYERVVIGANCLIAANTQIFDGSGHDLCMDNPSERINTKGTAKPIYIEDNVWIGINCIILPGVRLGHGSVIAAGSVVTKDIPPMCVAGGNPAKVIRSY